MVYIPVTHHARTHWSSVDECRFSPGWNWSGKRCFKTGLMCLNDSTEHPVLIYSINTNIYVQKNKNLHLFIRVVCFPPFRLLSVVIPLFWHRHSAVVPDPCPGSAVTSTFTHGEDYHQSHPAFFFNSPFLSLSLLSFLPSFHPFFLPFFLPSFLPSMMDSSAGISKLWFGIPLCAAASLWSVDDS